MWRRKQKFSAGSHLVSISLLPGRMFPRLLWRTDGAAETHRRIEDAFEELAAQEETEAFEELLEKVYGEPGPTPSFGTDSCPEFGSKALPSRLNLWRLVTNKDFCYAGADRAESIVDELDASGQLEDAARSVGRALGEPGAGAAGQEGAPAPGGGLPGRGGRVGSRDLQRALVEVEREDMDMERRRIQGLLGESSTRGFVIRTLRGSRGRIVPVKLSFRYSSP